jgi:glyoxylase-like metal-dependent hydrolase (beta-lactamase superfamily II)
MLNKVKWQALNTGYCTSLECFAIKGGGFHFIKFPSTCILLQHEDHGNILFDTGYAPHYFSATKQWPYCCYRALLKVYHCEKDSAVAQLKSQNIDPSTIDLIILSHLHADHYAGIQDFPHALFLLHEEAYQSIQVHSTSKKSNLSPWEALKKGFLPDMLPEKFSQRTKLLRQEDFSSSVRENFPFSSAHDIFNDRSCLLIELPGHAKGQMGLLVNERDFFVSDASWLVEGIKKNCCPPQWILKKMDDCEAYVDTLNKLHICIKKFSDMRFYPTHDESLWADL